MCRYIFFPDSLRTEPMFVSERKHEDNTNLKLDKMDMLLIKHESFLSGNMEMIQPSFSTLFFSVFFSSSFFQLWDF